MIKHIDHVGIKVSNLPHICQALKNLGILCSSIEKYDEVGLQIASLGTWETSIELLEVIDQNSPIAHDKLGLHHLALKTDDIEEIYNKMKASSYYKSEGGIHKGAHNRKIFFFKISGHEDIFFECVE
jgi:hypothetical protein